MPDYSLPAREKLQNLNAQSKAELENSLLKENLTEYTELFEKLKNEQNAFLQQVTKTTEELKQTVSELKNSNELLNSNLNREIEIMTSNIKTATNETIKSGLQTSINEMNATAQKIADFKNKLEKSTDMHLNEFERKMRRFFAFDDVVKWVFWGGCVANIISLGLLLWVVFGR
jgi:isoleucyl-tRNA synthetase